jgi:DNA-binding NarL/FixJ family response regulator
MPARSIRVLVAEDYAPFRRFLASTVANRPEWQIICEVEDGSEAVQQAGALQPEVVLLDIGLPRLNGIEAARQIRNLSPKSTILFVSQESSADIVQAALEAGAKGYVVKADAGRELIPALEAVLRNQTYVSKSLSGYGLTNVQDTSASHVLEMGHGFETRRQPGLQSTRQHEVAFYSDDRSLLDGYTHFVRAVLKSGNAAIVVATEPHRETLLLRLQGYGLDMSAAIDQGRYVALDDAETIATFMVDDLPDRAQFSKVTGDLIARTAKSVEGEHARVAACGECAPRLWDRGNAEGAVRLERLWDEIARSYGVQVFCAYRLGSFQGGTGSYPFERICAEHSRVLSW